MEEVGVRFIAWALNICQEIQTGNFLPKLRALVITTRWIQVLTGHLRISMMLFMQIDVIEEILRNEFSQDHTAGILGLLFNWNRGDILPLREIGRNMGMLT